MAKSFRLDLGEGRQLTKAGWLVVVVASLATAGLGVSFLHWGFSIVGTEDPFLGFSAAVGAGVVAFAIGWLILCLLRIPLLRKPEAESAARPEANP